MINPFELLGLEQGCSLQELRKAYYDLALYCHPDKGGSPNDMILLQTAYAWIKNQLEIVKEQGEQTYESIQESYEQYKNEFPISKVPNFISIASEALDYNKEKFQEICKAEFVPEDWIEPMYEAILLRLFTILQMDQYVQNSNLAISDETSSSLSAKLWDVVVREVRLMSKQGFEVGGGSSVPHGYGNMMDKLPMRNIELPISNGFGRKELIKYESPESIVSSESTTVNMIQPQDKLEDYSIYQNGIYDYKLAFSEPCDDAMLQMGLTTEQQERIQLQPSALLETFQAARHEQDENAKANQEQDPTVSLGFTNLSLKK